MKTRRAHDDIEDGIGIFVWGKRATPLRVGAKVGELYVLGTREETASLVELLYEPYAEK